MNQSIKKMAALLLSCILIPSLAFPTFALEASTPKEEVVYFNLNGDGTVQGTYVVNIFELSEDGSIVDYGNYSSTRNLTTNDSIEEQDGKITIPTKKGKLYYQGDLENTEMPWIITVHYYLNGVEYPANDIAGQSGALEIKLGVANNPAADPSFFENYAIQASVTLDTEKCTDILADGATMANVGSDKQLTYTILPGDEKEYSIQSQVTDFEMDGIQINGVSLNLGIDIPDTDEITDKVQELQDGINELDDGSVELDDGVTDLQDGFDELMSGANELQDGINDLLDASPDLNSGSNKIKKAINDINSALGQITVPTESLEELTSGSSAVTAGIDNLVLGISQLQGGIDSYNNGLEENGINKSSLQESNAQTISLIGDQIQALQTAIEAMQDHDATADTSDLEAQLATFEQIKLLLEADSALIDADSSLIGQLESGSDTLYNGASLLQDQYIMLDDAIGQLPDMLSALAEGLPELKTAIGTLAKSYATFDSGLDKYTNAFEEIADGYDELYDGLIDAADGVDDLKDATEELKDGTAELRDKTKDMDKDVSDKVDELKNKIPTNDFTPKSFVSEQNNQIKSVQFVIKTASIALQTQEEIPEQSTNNPSFWQKLLNLFK